MPSTDHHLPTRDWSLPSAECPPVSPWSSCHTPVDYPCQTGPRPGTCPAVLSPVIIMYICHALINGLSAHMIHINLNMIFYTHVEHSPTKTNDIKYYTKQKQKRTTNTHTHERTHTHTYAPPPHTHDCSRNWVLVLVRMEIL